MAKWKKFILKKKSEISAKYDDLANLIGDGIEAWHLSIYFIPRLRAETLLAHEINQMET